MSRRQHARGDVGGEVARELGEPPRELKARVDPWNGRCLEPFDVPDGLGAVVEHRVDSAHARHVAHELEGLGDLEDRTPFGAGRHQERRLAGGGFQRAAEVGFDVFADREGREDRGDAEGHSEDGRRRTPAVPREVARRHSHEHRHGAHPNEAGSAQT